MVAAVRAKSVGGIAFDNVLGHGPFEHRANGLLSVSSFAGKPLVGCGVEKLSEIAALDFGGFAGHHRSQGRLSLCSTSPAVLSLPVTRRLTYSLISCSTVKDCVCWSRAAFSLAIRSRPFRAALVISFARSASRVSPTSS